MSQNGVGVAVAAGVAVGEAEGVAVPEGGIGPAWLANTTRVVNPKARAAAGIVDIVEKRPADLIRISQFSPIALEGTISTRRGGRGQSTRRQKRLDSKR
jgi:hypothetical protein